MWGLECRGWGYRGGEWLGGLDGTWFHRAGALGEWVWPGWHLVLLLSGLPCVYGLAGTWFHRAGALIECLGLAGTCFHRAGALIECLGLAGTCFHRAGALGESDGV